MKPLSPLCVALVLAVTSNAFAAEAGKQGTSTDAPVSAPASEPNPPNTYVAAVAGTTLLYRPTNGSVEGPQADLNTAFGLGRFVTDSIALELDVGASFARGKYSALSLVPGVVWVFHKHLYAAARFLVPVHPQANLGILPGLGAIYVFKNGIAPVLELSAVSMLLARGGPDLGASATVGSLYLF